MSVNKNENSKNALIKRVIDPFCEFRCNMSSCVNCPYDKATQAKPARKLNILQRLNQEEIGALYEYQKTKDPYWLKEYKRVREENKEWRNHLDAC